MSEVLGSALGLLQIHLHLPVLLWVGRLFSFVSSGLGSIQLPGALLSAEVCPSSLLCWPLFYPMGRATEYPVPPGCSAQVPSLVLPGLGSAKDGLPTGTENAEQLTPQEHPGGLRVACLSPGI